MTALESNHAIFSCLYLSLSLQISFARYYLTVLSLSSVIPSSIRTSLISLICLVKVCFQAVRTMWIVAVSLQSMMRCTWNFESFAGLLTSKLLIDASLRFRDMIVSEGSPVSAFVEWIVRKRRRVLPSMCTQMQPHIISNAQTYAHWRKTVCFCRLTLMYLPKRFPSKVSERTARQQAAQHCQCMVSNILRTIHYMLIFAFVDWQTVVGCVLVVGLNRSILRKKTQHFRIRWIQMHGAVTPAFGFPSFCHQLWGNRLTHIPATCKIKKGKLGDKRK